MPDLDLLPVRRSPTDRRYGFKPGLHLLSEQPADTSGLSIAAEVDPRHALPPIFDQGQLGSCTANAAAAAFQYDSILDHGAGKGAGLLSRLFIYYGERKIEGSLGQGDVGAYGHDAFTVAKAGIPEEAAWPYDISTFEGPVPKKAITDEAHYKLTKPVKIVPRDEQSFKAALSNRQTIAIGFTVYESFETSSVAAHGVVPMPKRGEQVLGGHEVLIVGYLKSEPHYALVRNSWGTGWGISGYFLMPWAYILSASLSSDYRTIQRPAGK